MNPKFKHYAGTNNVDMQGPTAGQNAGEWLDLSTPLLPFTNADMSPVTSMDVIDIEGSLNYTYGPGSFSDPMNDIALDKGPLAAPDEVSAQAEQSQPVVGVSGISRTGVNGSFVIGVTAVVDGERKLVHYDSVLSRWNVQGCANCQANVKVKSFAPMNNLFSSTDAIANDAQLGVDIISNAGISQPDNIVVQPAKLRRNREQAHEPS